MSDYAQFLEQFVRSYKHPVLISKPEHYIIRCPYCGDSVKHFNKGHLYISKLQPVFYCVRCDTGGHISKLLPAISDRLTNFQLLQALLASVQTSNISLEVEPATNTTCDNVLSHLLQVILADARIRTWFRFYRNITKDYTMISFPYTPTVDPNLLLSEVVDNRTLQTALGQSDFERFTRILKRHLLDAEAIYIGLNGIQIRLRRKRKGIRFVSWRSDTLSQLLHLRRLSVAYAIDVRSTRVLDLLDFAKQIQQHAHRVKHIHQTVPTLVVLSESVTDLSAFAKNFLTNSALAQQIGLLDLDFLIMVPALNKGLLYGYSLTQRLLSKMRLVNVVGYYLLVDSDAVVSEAKIVQKLVTNKPVCILLPQQGKDYRDCVEVEPIVHHLSAYQKTV